MLMGSYDVAEAVRLSPALASSLVGRELARDVARERATYRVVIGLHRHMRTVCRRGSPA